ncbi:HAD family hydrolase [Tabrizicola sp.]|uniref:HAD family hydrolase n=1 Tax=Tabrizicola sp. TaxID=2005166 RepID=UPI003D2D9109
MIDAAIFDKDGTLFDFRATWGGWTARAIDQLAGFGADRAGLARRLGYDVAAAAFAKDSPVIASTTPELVDIMHEFVPDMGKGQLLDILSDLSEEAPQAEAAPLRLVFEGLRARGLKLGLATNDTEAPARAHLAGAGVLELFDFVAGCDSGWGGKPAPGQLLAFAARVGVDPARAVMVGDSLHDLHAGRAAGMRCVAVLTGIAEAHELAPHADVVLPDISHLAAWIDAQSGR